MPITIGGVPLPSTTLWTDREHKNTILQDRVYTLGGKQKITYFSLPSGRDITLEGVQGVLSTGWIRKSEYDAVYALSTVPGATYIFDYNGEQHTVMFKHENPPAMFGAPLVYRNNQADEDYYTFIIKLITV